MKPNEESISTAFEDWSAIQARSSNATASFLKESTADLKDSKPVPVTKDHREVPAEPVVSRRYFSIDPLLFWAFHLAIVAVSLGIMWAKVDKTTRALEKLLKAQNEEVDLAKGEKAAAEAAYAAARKAEQQRSIDLQGANATLTALVERVNANQESIRTNQDSIKQILDTVGQTNEVILKASRDAQAA